MARRRERAKTMMAGLIYLFMVYSFCFLREQGQGNREQE
jgi:hypothetical protein